MDKKELKNKTAELIDVMIKQAEKGPSGFWTEDFEGCGNPEIFPEFQKGLKSGALIQKKHYCCPWNWDIFYGSKAGNINSGCAHQCVIREAKYLSSAILRDVLRRFKKNMNSGKYDKVSVVEPLLTENEFAYIKKQKEIELKNKEKRCREEIEIKRNKACELLKRYKDNEWAKSIIVENYEDDNNACVEGGIIEFNPDSLKNVVGGEKLSYDDYIDIQIRSLHRQRTGFENVYMNIPDEYKGCIEKKNDKRICFKRVYISAMFPDDLSFFEDTEDHVWMDIKGFEEYNVGDSVSFFADVYRYIKTRDGKLIDYSLRNPQNIKKIESYELPSNEDLAKAEIDRIICESCYLNEQCSCIGFCMRDKKEKKALRKQLFDLVNNSRSDKK